MAIPNAFTNVVGSTVLRGGGTALGGGLGGGFYQPAVTQVDDLELARQRQAQQSQRTLQQGQLDDQAAARAAQAQQNDLNRAQQLGLQNSAQGFQSQQNQSAQDQARFLQSSTQGFQRDTQNTQNAFDASQLASTQGFNASESSADRAFQGAQNDANRYFQGTQADLQRQFSGGQNDADRANQLGLANISADTARRGQDIGLQQANLPFQYRDRVLAQFQPQLQGAFDRIGGGGGANLDSYINSVGGNSPAAPNLPSSEVYNPNQVQQQVNAARAQGDQIAGDQVRQSQREFAGRGYGSRGPAQSALEAQIRAGSSASNADQERQIRFGAAGANAQQGLAVGGLANTRYANENDADIRRRTLAVGARNSDSQNNISLIQAILGIA